MASVFGIESIAAASGGDSNTASVVGNNSLAGAGPGDFNIASVFGNSRLTRGITVALLTAIGNNCRLMGLDQRAVDGYLPLVAGG